MKLPEISPLLLLITCIQKPTGKLLSNLSCSAGYNELVPKRLTGKNFILDLLVSGADPFLKITLELPKGFDQSTITFETFESVGSSPNINSDKSYAKILYKDVDGITQYQKDYIKNEKLTPQKKTFNLTGSGQEKISVVHQDPKRCLLKNNSKKRALPVVTSKIKLLI